MAITNHERIGKCLEQLSSGLQPFVERELKSSYQDNWFAETRRTLSATQVDFLGTADCESEHGDDGVRLDNESMRRCRGFESLF